MNLGKTCPESAGRAQGVLPDADDLPTQNLELSGDLSIPRAVPSEFLIPILAVT